MTHPSVRMPIRVDPTFMSVEIIIEDPRWTGLEALANNAAKATFDHLGLVFDDWEIALLACDDARIQQLNTGFRGKPAATNVLSWPSVDRSADKPGAKPLYPTGERSLGDIAIAYDTCMREAGDGNNPPDDHVTHLIVHGVLHLLGYDHQRDADADLMESIETAILYKLGVPDPYSGEGHSGPDM